MIRSPYKCDALRAFDLTIDRRILRIDRTAALHNEGMNFDLPGGASHRGNVECLLTFLLPLCGFLLLDGIQQEDVHAERRGLRLLREKFDYHRVSLPRPAAARRGRKVDA